MKFIFKKIEYTLTKSGKQKIDDLITEEFKKQFGNCELKNSEMNGNPSFIFKKFLNTFNGVKFITNKRRVNSKI